jgi:hypothetical protein
MAEWAKLSGSQCDWVIRKVGWERRRPDDPIKLTLSYLKATTCSHNFTASAPRFGTSLYDQQVPDPLYTFAYGREQAGGVVVQCCPWTNTSPGRSKGYPGPRCDQVSVASSSLPTDAIVSQG